jgi:hypothetical protein
MFELPVVAVAQAAAPAQTCALHAQITDEDGGAVIRAFVLIHSDYGRKLNQQVNPDPIAQIVDFRSCKPLNLNLMVTIDPDRTETDDY